MQIADPERWLEDLRTKVADVQAKSTAMIENVIATAATVTSKDGAVTVTISPTGALQNIELKQRAAGMSPGKLTASIMEAVRAGQRSASAQVVESFSSLGEEGSESMELLLAYLPDAEEDAQQEDPEADFARPAAEEETPPPKGAPPHAQAQPAPAPPPQTAKPTRPQPADDVDPDNNPW